MIPFRDNIPSRTFPFVTIGLILVNVVVFFQEMALGSHLPLFFQTYGLIPLRVVHSLFSLDPDMFASLFTLFSSMFLHGGWLHIIGNLWFLWIFGGSVEDFLGHFKFLSFYLLCGLLGNVAQVFFNYASPIPSIGASGAIAGVLGAYMILFPGARVLTLIPLFIIWPIVELPALVVLGFWFVEQFMFGFSSLASATDQAGGVAWFAHIGGFVAGMILILRTRRSRRHRSGLW
jgi:hypothetical protein